MVDFFYAKTQIYVENNLRHKCGSVDFATTNSICQARLGTAKWIMRKNRLANGIPKSANKSKENKEFTFLVFIKKKSKF